VGRVKEGKNEINMKRKKSTKNSIIMGAK